MTTPRDLGKTGGAFWRAVNEAYELNREDERVLLHQCALMLDELDDLRRIVERDGRVVTDQRGRPAMHPAAVEARQVRAVLRASLKQLRLPDPETGDDDITAQARINGRRT